VPSPEWAAFGSFLFLLPQLELLEADGGLILALNVAWDSRCVQLVKHICSMGKQQVRGVFQ
jgi:hypothetical protein